ncbi:transcription factor GTE11-like [Vicia villosa]|uniref:transcription factor GTE11-like n=1 Tax=Vicia villosa TaxID=3911 RepID=UPI00273BF935|nr:transcription factor GTE11-like [Vicia villosa]
MASTLTPSVSHNTNSSLTTSNTNPSSSDRKRLIVKLTYSPGSRKRHSDSSCGTDDNKRSKFQDSVKPTVTCYWVDSNYHTKTTPFSLSQPNTHNALVENNNHVSDTVMSQPKGVKESSKMAKDKINASSKKASMTKEMVKDNIKAKPEESSRTTSLMVKAKECVLKKPMECVKRRQCWLILKRMLVGRDGWDLKDPPAMVDNVSESKPIGLNETGRKLRMYATPDEFASDMRLVFSNAMLMYPPRNHIYQIAKKFSYNFELKWKSLKDEWELEDRKRRKAHKTRRY